MTQDERWQEKYNVVKDFIEKNHRNPSRHNTEDHMILNWIKRKTRCTERQWLPFSFLLINIIVIFEAPKIESFKHIW